MSASTTAPATRALTDLQQAYLAGRERGPGLSGIDATIRLDLRVDPEVASFALLHDRLRPALEQVAASTPALSAQVDRDGIRLDDEQTPVVERRHPAGHGLQLDVGPLRVQLTLTAGAARLIVHGSQVLLDLPSLVRTLDQVMAHVTGRDVVQLPLATVDTTEREAARRRWQRRLEALPTLHPEIPRLRSPEDVGTPRFRHVTRRLPAATWERLQVAARSQAMDPADLPFVAVAEVVRAFSRPDRFCLVEAHQDEMARARLAIGQATVAGLVPVTGRAEQTFGDRARDLAAELAQTRELSAWSAIRILRERRTQLAEVSAPVVFTNLLRDGLEHALRWGHLEDLQVETPHVWCECEALETDGELLLGWHYVDGLFPDGVIDDMVGCTVRLLQRAADDPGVWSTTGQVVDLPLAAAVEQSTANDTQQPIPAARLHDLVLTQAGSRPDALAVVDREGGVTYGELVEQARRVAGGIRAARALEPGELVAVMTPAGRDQVAAILGVLLAGGAYVVIDPGLPQERRSSLLHRCEVRVAVAPPLLASSLAGTGIDIVDAGGADAPLGELAETSDDDLAYVVFTSGSTGEPKGVMVRHHSAANTVQDIARRYDLGADDAVLALAPASFDLSVFDVFGLLGAGGTVVIPDPARAADPTHWIELILEHRITVWNTVPAPMRLLVDALEEGQQARVPLRTVLLSGDWIPLDLPDRIRRVVPAAEVVALGGATEASIWSISHPVRHLEPGWASVPYGTALANQQMYVLNAWGEPCPRWVTGEIHIGGIGVAQGYWRDPVRTEERFVRHPRTGERLYRTGDLGRLRGGGLIEILGREDAQVKINGYRVELGEIESVLLRSDAVGQVVVQAPTHPATGRRQVVAYVVPGPDAGAEVQERVRGAAADHLPSYMVPSSVVLIERVPLTSNGKVDRTSLPEPWPAREPTEEDTSRDDEVVDTVRRIWSERLGHDDFGVEDGYFDVGGDSLHAVAILRDLRDTYGFDEAVETDLMEALFLNGGISSVAEIVRGTS